MTGWRVGAAAAVAVLASVAAACGGDSEKTATTFTGTDGTALYAQACASCHGADLRGTDQGPPFLDAIYRPGHHADAAFFLAAKAGARAHHWDFGNMPPVEGLSDAQIEAIVAFVRERQGRPESSSARHQSGEAGSGAASWLAETRPTRTARQGHPW